MTTCTDTVLPAGALRESDSVFPLGSVTVMFMAQTVGGLDWALAKPLSLITVPTSLFMLLLPY